MGFLVAVGVTVMIAFPDFMVPEEKRKKLKFSGRHWGAYQDAKASDDADEEHYMEVGIPAKKIRHVVGSSTYAGGRGK